MYNNNLKEFRFNSHGYETGFTAHWHLDNLRLIECPVLEDDLPF